MRRKRISERVGNKSSHGVLLSRNSLRERQASVHVTLCGRLGSIPIRDTRNHAQDKHRTFKKHSVFAVDATRSGARRP